MKKYLIVLPIVTVLVACNPEREQAKAFLKCGIAAKQLEQDKAVKIMSKKSEQVNLNFSARDTMYLGQEIREELGLYDAERSDLAKIYTLIKVYNSSECVDLHEQPKIDAGFLYYILYPFI